MLIVALFLEFVVALFLRLLLETLRVRAGGCLLLVGAGISGAEGVSLIPVVMVEVWQQHLQRR